jgi:hypothetical protein
VSGADRWPFHAVPVRDAWHFHRPRPSLLTLVDCVFAGWNQIADIAWPGRGFRLRIEAGAGY